MIRRRLACLAFVWPLFPALAQEPQPVRLRSSMFSDPEGVSLVREWRFSSEDAGGREAPDLDDQGWRPVRPGLLPGELPPGGWTGAGWFRRHLLVEPTLQHRDLALRFAAKGLAEVYLDGRLVLATGRGGVSPVVPWPRRDAYLVSLAGQRHLLAVRYLFPRDAPVPPEGIGFELSLADPAVLPRQPSGGNRRVFALEGALVALPAFLALFHLALFAFDPRARENLFYAALMAALAVLVLNDVSGDLFPSEGQRDLIGSFARAGPFVAIFFGLLTYYAVRTRPFSRSWRAFALAALLLVAAAYALPASAEYGWMALFAAMIIEVVRVERSGPSPARRGSWFLGVSFAIAVLAVTLQILVNFGVLESVAGVRSIHVAGMIALAAGMSLYLARSLGDARGVEAEDARKGRELARAREVQLAMLPRELPKVSGLDLAATTCTAAEVGGDFYDVRRDESGGILIAFGDATGHGLSAGIMVAAVKALFTSLDARRPVLELLGASGRALAEMRLPRIQMCLLLARVTAAEVAVASAAMPPLLVRRRATGQVEELGAPGLPLGTLLPPRHEERRARLEPGDTLLFASDGFAELRDETGRELGFAGAAASFERACGAGSAAAVVGALVEEVARFRGRRPQDDDITFLVVRSRLA